MEKPTNENFRYNDEVLFLDGLLEFHPEIFAELEDSQRQLLEEYYLTGVNYEDLPENIFEYRKILVDTRPEIVVEAQQAFTDILERAGIDNFHYTSKN